MKNIIFGVFSTLISIIIGKIIFYYIIVFFEKMYTRFFEKPNYRIVVLNILEHLSNNKEFISNVTTMVDIENKNDDNIYLNIISLPLVQKLIQNEIDTSEMKLNKSEIEHQLKLIFIKCFGGRL